jgi:hypothetical protein
MDRDGAIGIVRLMLSQGVDRELAINNPAIPQEYREEIRSLIASEDTFILRPTTVLTGNSGHYDWLTEYDRSNWYFWKNLREYLLGHKNFSKEAVQNLDDSSDTILRQLADPKNESFDIKGLVLGYVQSGKTASYTALIAKAVDVGYRLIIVLSGIDNALRRQTQIRLDRELVGSSKNGGYCVRQPEVLLVMKKNGAVLKRLLQWLDEAPANNLFSLPVLLIDDEADLASIDTRGSYIREEDTDDLPDDYEEPTVINGLIRTLLEKFRKKAYVAYTATPFANVLIPHDKVDAQGLSDLYPKDFIIDLPKPAGYLGAEELFGRFDVDSETDFGNTDAIRHIPENEASEFISNSSLPLSLEKAIFVFFLACAARSARGDEDKPTTMLIHVSHLVATQMLVYRKVEESITALKNEWRYLKRDGLEAKLQLLWEAEYQHSTQLINDFEQITFDKIKPHLNKAFESVEIKAINYRTGDLLNYEEKPNLKVIAIGGNRLSRGLTLEGLVSSYFYRPTIMYDTLLQMGRWFGYRKGYEDLVRIYMTQDLASRFSDLARVEYEIREDIKLYEAQGMTPMELGLKIYKHPSMLVTSRLKQRFAQTITINQSYSGHLLQTFRFPFINPTRLLSLLENNLVVTQKFLASLGPPIFVKNRPQWEDVNAEAIIGFLEKYQIDAGVRNIYLPLVTKYIKFQNDHLELKRWTVIVPGRETLDSALGSIDLTDELEIPMISRTRLKADLDSLGVITSPGDETLDLDTEELVKLEEFRATNPKVGINPAARSVRDPTKGLLLIYPVSKYSGREIKIDSKRTELFKDPDQLGVNNLIGLALSFPFSSREFGKKDDYVFGTVPWSQDEHN